MIKNYSRPQLLIKQVLEQIETAYDPGMNALVIGAQYDLNRVNNPEEFAEMQGSAVDLPTDDQSVQLVSFENYKQDSEIVDDYTRLYGENLEARLVKYGICGADSNDDDSDDSDVDSTGVSWSILSTETPDKIIAKDIDGNTISVGSGQTENLHASLKGRPVTPGDIVYVTYKGEKVKRQVVSVERALESAETNTLSGSKLNPELTFRADAPIVSTTVSGNVTAAFTQTDAVLLKYLKAGSRYNGEFAERFEITVTTTTGKGAGNVGRCSISSSSGNFSANDVVIVGQAGVADFVIQDNSLPGLVITASNAVNSGDGLFNGDTFSVTASIGYNPIGSDNFKFVGSYVYDQDDTLIFEVTKAGEDLSDPYKGAILNISDTAGRLSGQDHVLSRDGSLDQSEYIVIGDTGLSFRMQDLTDDLDTHQKGLRVGDVFSLKLVVGKTSGKHAVVKLNGIAGNTVGRTDTDDDMSIDCVEYRVAYTGFIPSIAADSNNPQWVADSRSFIDDVSNDNFGINVFTGLKVKKHDRGAGYQWLKVCNDSRYGKLFAHYKAFVPAKQNEEIVFVTAAPTGYGDVTAPISDDITLGKVDIENPVAMGMNIALQAAQGRGIFVARVASEDVAGYRSVLERAERNSNIYAIAPLTDDLGIQEACKGHVGAMSTEDKKRWRRCYLGTNSPYSYPVIVQDPVSLLRPEASITYHQGANTRVVDEKGNFVDQKVRPGDLFRTSYHSIEGVETYKEYVVKEVVTNEELLLKTGPSNPTTLPVGYEVHKSDSVANIVDYVGKRSVHFSDRRVVNVWTDGARYSTGSGELALNNFYLAAEMAGLRSALQPHQGITNIQIGTVNTASTMYTKYTENNLDTVAAQGTWVITQDYEGSPVYVRHQLTTQTEKGSLYYEDSVGTNLDEISYVINDALQSYIGVRNADVTVVSEIYNEVFGLLYDRTKTEAGVDIGPQIAGFSDLTVAIDDTFKDRVNVSVSLELPLPLNTIVVTLNTTATLSDVEIAQSAAVRADATGKILSVEGLNES
tara:strand:- start:14722 stop:17796 length:3075 start_codon:yes stop_codon:yes gene_type:complete